MIIMILQLIAAVCTEGVKAVTDFGNGQIIGGIQDIGLLVGWVLAAFHLHITIPGFINTDSK